MEADNGSSNGHSSGQGNGWQESWGRGGGGKGKGKDWRRERQSEPPVAEAAAGKGRRGRCSRSRSRSGSPDTRRQQRQPSPEKTKPKPRPWRVQLSQLPRDMEEDEFVEIIADYGAALEHELHREGSYKCGWVEYATKDEAAAAVAALNERRMDEWHLRLQAYMYPGGDAIGGVVTFG